MTSYIIWSKTIQFSTILLTIIAFYYIRDPLKFDVFSIGLVFCQLLFNLLDDRTDAGFRQQLDDADYDINIWLERELQATLRPVSAEGFLLLYM